MSISITSLEKSALVLAKKLAKQGYEVKTDTFRNTGCSSSRPSYVKMSVSKGKVYVSIKFLANGYSSTRSTRSSELGGWGMKWSEMKAEFLNRLEKRTKMINS